MRHRASKAELLARMQRAFRPKLKPDQLLDLGLCHVQNLDAIATGAAEPSIIWDYVGCVLTWWRVAELLGMGCPQMAVQLEVATQLVEKFGRTGHVQFDGPGLQLARMGVMVMDRLAEIVDRQTAITAANWSEIEVGRLASAAGTHRAQEAQAA